jgi:rsbT co-antagonist protein RsbR
MNVDMDSIPFVILENIEDAVLAIDQNYRITYLNPPCELLLDIKKDEAIGEGMYEFFPEAPEEFRHVENTVKFEKELALDEVPLKWGKYNKYIKIRTHLLKDSQTVTGAFVQFTDVTEQVVMRDRLNKRMEEMAVTLIPLSDEVVLLPLQPTYEQFNFNYILDKSLTEIVELKPKVLVVDLSMIYETSPMFFEIIEMLKKAVKLLGISVTISGLRPEVSKEWVQSKIKQYETTYFGTLKSALKVINLDCTLNKERV